MEDVVADDALSFCGSGVARKLCDAMRVLQSVMLQQSSSLLSWWTNDRHFQRMVVVVDGS